MAWWGSGHSQTRGLVGCCTHTYYMSEPEWQIGAELLIHYDNKEGSGRIFGKSGYVGANRGDFRAQISVPII